MNRFVRFPPDLSPVGGRHPEWTPRNPQLDDRTFGMELLLCLRDCTKPITGESLCGWVTDLVERIGMTAFGEPRAEYFGLADPKTAGWSLTQLIETSLISAHEMPLVHGIAINVFSCKCFNPVDAVAQCVDRFGGWVAHRTVLRRG